MRVRHTREEDIPFAIRHMQSAMASGLFKHLKPSPTEYAHYIRMAIKDDKTFYIRTIEHDDKCIGGFFGHVFKPVFSKDLIAEDFVMFIAEEFRGRAGRCLVEIVRGFEAWAKERGAKIIIFGIVAGIDNEKPHEMYTKLGFPPIGYIHGRSL